MVLTLVMTSRIYKDYKTWQWLDVFVFWYFYVNKWLITNQFAMENLFNYRNWR